MMLFENGLLCKLMPLLVGLSKLSLRAPAALAARFWKLGEKSRIGILYRSAAIGFVKYPSPFPVMALTFSAFVVKLLF